MEVEEGSFILSFFRSFVFFFFFFFGWDGDGDEMVMGL